MRLKVLGWTDCALLVCLLAATAGGCGGDGGSPLPHVASPTPTPAAFAGSFAGTAALYAGRTGTVSFTVQNDASARGTLTITGGSATPITVPLTGFVSVSSGNFSLSGSFTDAGGTEAVVVSGTLPQPGDGSGFLAVQIATTRFVGTIDKQ